MRKLIALILLKSCVTLSYLNAINKYYPSGAESGGLGNITVVLKNEYSAINNPALLPYVSSNHIAVSYTNKYMIKDLDISQLCTHYHTNNGTWHFNLQQVGFAGYNEYNLGLGYARKFGENLSASFSLIGLNITSTYQEKQLFQLSSLLALHYNFSKKLALGISLFNPTASEYEMQFYSDQIPVIGKIGLASYHLDDVILLSEIELSDLGATNLKIGIAYNFYNACYVRVGGASNPELISVGVGYQLKSFKVDFAIQSLQRLGKNAIISFSYAF